jgi:hypothetical protein
MFKLAEKGNGLVSQILVGAILVKDGKIMEGYHKNMVVII